LKIKDLRLKKDIKHPLLTEGDGNAAGITVFETFARKNRGHQSPSTNYVEGPKRKCFLKACHLNKTKNASGSHDVLELKLPLFKPRLARNKRR